MKIQIALMIMAAFALLVGFILWRTSRRGPARCFPEEVTMFRTSDRMVFEDPDDADEHQARIDQAYPGLLNDSFK